jgi:hypothetical protein
MKGDRIMSIRHALLAVLAAALTASAASAAAFDDVKIFAATRFESHSLEARNQADNSLLTTLTFVSQTGRQGSALVSIGHKQDLEDSESDGLALSASYVHNFSRSSYALVGYSNYHSYQSVDDGRIDDTSDMIYIAHGWKVLKRDRVQGTLFTTMSTDTAFDDNRMISETVRFTGPVGRTYRWNAGYQLGYSLVDDRRSLGALEAGVAKPVSRQGVVSVSHRRVSYVNNPGADLEDNQWIVAYSHKIR